jgi:hypothetical protein
MDGGWALARGLALAAMIFAAIGTWPVCALLLALYRRAVHRGMQAQQRSEWPGRGMLPPAPQSGSVPPPVGSYGRPTTIAVVEAAVADAPTAHWLTELRRRGTRTRWAFGVAALGYGLAAVVVTTIVLDLEWLPVRSLAFLALLTWPALPTALSLSTRGRRFRLLLVAAWVAIVVALLRIGGLSLPQVVLFILLETGIPVAYVVLTTGVRYLRGAAWLVAPGLAVLGLVVVDLAFAGYSLILGLGLAPEVRPGLVRSLVLLVVLLAYAWAIGRAYVAKWVSEESLLVLQWWVVAAVWSVADSAAAGLLAALLGLTPLVVLLLILLIAARIGPGERGRPRRLLLLRTFGARQRSTRLLRELTRRWRWVGSVELITAPDVATETLEPDEFLDFIRGDLARRFVREPAAVPKRLASLDLEPDADGRYRINELMCTDDTWRPTVEGLIGSVDVIMIDLRGFTARRLGVVEELQRLTAGVSLRRVVALVDSTTDWTALHAALGRAAALAPVESPLSADPTPYLSVVSDPERPDGSRRLFAALMQASA